MITLGVKGLRSFLSIALTSLLPIISCMIRARTLKFLWPELAREVNHLYLVHVNEYGDLSFFFYLFCIDQ